LPHVQNSSTFVVMEEVKSYIWESSQFLNKRTFWRWLCAFG
jgi:hypothetical protein